MSSQKWSVGRILFPSPLHVADSNRWYLGAGHLDFKSILDTLFATGYQGYVSGESMPLPDADTSAERGLAYLRQLYTS